MVGAACGYDTKQEVKLFDNSCSVYTSILTEMGNTLGFFDAARSNTEKLDADVLCVSFNHCMVNDQHGAVCL